MRRRAAQECCVESVAVYFLHSYRNPQHEQRAGDILKRDLPHIRVSLSHEVLPEMLEFSARALRSSTPILRR
jgi:N-methylhydantoinase A